MTGRVATVHDLSGTVVCNNCSKHLLNGTVVLSAKHARDVWVKHAEDEKFGRGAAQNKTTKRSEGLAPGECGPRETAQHDQTLLGSVLQASIVNTSQPTGLPPAWFQIRVFPKCWMRACPEFPPKDVEDGNHPWMSSKNELSLVMSQLLLHSHQGVVLPQTEKNRHECVALLAPTSPATMPLTLLWVSARLSFCPCE